MVIEFICVEKNFIIFFKTIRHSKLYIIKINYTNYYSNSLFFFVNKKKIKIKIIIHQVIIEQKI